MIPLLGISMAVHCYSEEPEVSGNAEPGREYIARKAGMRALESGVYEQAEKFFQQYKKDAGEDSKARMDAGECLAATYIRLGLPAKAQAELDSLNKEFPGGDQLRRALYQAEVYLLENKAKDAENALKAVLAPRKPVINELYFQSLSCLALAQARQQKWKEAADTYALLNKAAVNSAWERKAFLQALLNSIRGRDYKLANQLMKQAGKYKKDDKAKDIVKLQLLLLLEEKKLSEFQKAYSSETFSGPTDQELYLIDLKASENFAVADKYKEAIQFIKDAVKFAPDAPSRRYALLKMIDLYVAGGDKKSAAKTALDFASYYPDSPNAPTVSLRAADLLADSGDTEGALKICEDLTKNPKASTDQKAAAAIAAAEFGISQKKWDLAEKYCLFVDKLPASPVITGQGLFLIGETRMKRKLYKKSAEAFLELAGKNSQWEVRARYEAARALDLAGDFSAVLTQTDKIIAMKDVPKDLLASSLFLNGTALEQLGQRKKAVAVLKKMFETYPEHDLADDAIFRAGSIAFSQNDYDTSGICFSAFETKYHKSEFAPNALYKGVFSDLFKDKPDDAARKVAQLKKLYPGSKFTAAAMFRQADEYYSAGKYNESLSVLGSMEKMFSKDQTIVPRILAAEMAAHAKLGNVIYALKLQDRVKSDYPGFEGMAEMLFTAGDLASKAADYDQARKYFLQIPALRPDSAIAAAALGRAGDSYFALYSRTFKKEYLKEAAEQYKKVLESNKIYLANQSHKLSKAFYRYVNHKNGRSHQHCDLKKMSSCHSYLDRNEKVRLIEMFHPYHYLRQK